MAKQKSSQPPPAERSKPASLASLDELRFRRAVQQSVKQRILSNTELPAIRAPSLEGISVPLADPDLEISDADVLDALAEVTAEHVPRRPRAIREPIAVGDELTLSVVGFCQGLVVPFTFREEMVIEHLPGQYLPGFTEGLRGSKVGDSLQVWLTLPPDFGVEKLRGQEAVFAVSVLGAAQRLPLDVTSDAFLFSLGLGQSHEELFAALTEELRNDRVHEAWKRTVDAVYEQLHQRSAPNVPESLVDEELGRRWRRMEGDHLDRLKVSSRAQEAALESWLTDKALRADVQRGLARTQLLLAIADAEKLIPTRAEFQDMISNGDVLANADLKVVAKDLLADPALVRRITVEMMVQKAFRYVMNRCVTLPWNEPAQL